MTDEILLRKYPRTLYWPSSPSKAPGDRYIQNPEWYVGAEVLVTEKLDGSNVLLHKGEAYTRGLNKAPWLAMARKYAAWKTFTKDGYLYGEDIFGVHSIEYDAVTPDRTFYMFNYMDKTGWFYSCAELMGMAKELDMPMVPWVFYGGFPSVDSINKFFEKEMAKPSLLGGEREGLVMRLARGFYRESFPDVVCKVVRENHVQTDEHWSKNWKRCKLKNV